METALPLTVPPPQSSARLSSDAIELLSLADFFFFLVTGRVSGRGGMWKGAQLEPERISLATSPRVQEQFHTAVVSIAFICSKPVFKPHPDTSLTCAKNGVIVITAEGNL